MILECVFMHVYLTVYGSKWVGKATHSHHVVTDYMTHVGDILLDPLSQLVLDNQTRFSVIRPLKKLPRTRTLCSLWSKCILPQGIILVCVK